MNEALVVIVRGIISFFTLLIFTRLLGKQQLGEITFFDYIIGITLGNFAASLSIDLSSCAWPHWVGLLTWIILGILIQWAALKSRKVAKFVNDNATVVIHDGKVIVEELEKVKFTFYELLEQLRIKDVFDLNEVKLGIIEANGDLSVFKQDQFDGLINSLEETDPNVSVELIFNGIIINDNLPKAKVDHKWLLKELEKNHIDTPVEVFYAFKDSKKNLKIIKYKDKMICNSKNILD